MRVTLLVVMTAVLLAMMVYPSRLDSRQRAVAVRKYFENPNAQTSAELEHARLLDVRATLPFELRMALLFLLLLAGFVALGRDDILDSKALPDSIAWPMRLLLLGCVGFVFAVTVGRAVHAWFVLRA